tara:strand:- start:220 stop:726 length:507 start_codon:yes stop_codon:yes gene_type:complete
MSMVSKFTPDEKRQRKLESQRRYRAANKEKIDASYKEYNEKNRDLMNVRATLKRREAGVAPRKQAMPKEEQLLRDREHSRLSSERRRRAAGVPIKKAVPIDVQKARKRLRSIDRFKINPGPVRRNKRRHMTKTRIAKLLGVSLTEVPVPLFEAQLFVNNVIYQIRKMK